MNLKKKQNKNHMRKMKVSYDIITILVVLMPHTESLHLAAAKAFKNNKTHRVDYKTINANSLRYKSNLIYILKSK